MTPMEEQYWAVKNQYPNLILLYRMGDFYEIFGEDAKIASRVLELVLTSRSAGYASDMPMCGFPHHALDKYVAKLVAAGYKVAVADQLEDPKKTKKLVKRGVTRVVTPGTVTESAMLDEKHSNYLCAISCDGKVCAMSFADISTGEFAVCEFPVWTAKENIDTELARLSPKEILVYEGCPEDLKSALADMGIKYETITLDYAYGESDYSVLCNHFRVSALRGLGLEEYTSGLTSCAMIIKYIESNYPASLPSLTGFYNYSLSGYMVLDTVARKNLEISKSVATGTREGSLLYVIDKTGTAMGGRLLEKYINQPLLDPVMINRRLDMVEEFYSDRIMLEDCGRILKEFTDMERVMSRLLAGTNINPREIRALSSSIKKIPELKNCLSSAEGSLGELRDSLEDLRDISSEIDRTLKDELPFSTKDGGYIREGFSATLDEYRQAATEGKNWIAAMEQTEKERTGIKNLKTGYNNVFGYYIEVAKSQTDLVPDYFIRKQTLVNGERYITEELKSIEERILGSDEKAEALELEIFGQLREKITDRVTDISRAAKIVAELDVYMSFALVASERNYVRPKVNQGDEIRLRGGRHPVVEIYQKGNFIPNDTYINGRDERLLIITGPNMAGKSTYMRQTALIVLMAQAGSFVPCDQAEIGVVDRIFTRVGAHDELFSGQSTFMVEMNETANILNNATENSLVILDEIGRGTSTYDGLSIAWAVAEELNRIGAKTLFATHYHALNSLEEDTEGVKNYRIAVREDKDRVVWLRKVVPGGCDRSYGIEVARLAGLPESVIKRAKSVLRRFEENDTSSHIVPKPEEYKLSLFDIVPDPVLEEIKKLDLNTISPIEAMNMIYNWQKSLREDKVK
ncbi:MAG: DNA mismatch repair protein MutS [Armatimonadetes bacterium]|nr:DNA mismatch repair protein MutS [Candidatus Hippobium faecium]